MADEIKDQEKSKKKENRLAKPGVVVELIQSEQWTDDLSGVSLYRGIYQMATHEDMKKDKTAREVGFVKLQSEVSPTATLPPDRDLSRVEQALRLGILKIYNPKRPTEYKDRRGGASQAVYDMNDTSRGFKYRQEIDEKISKLLSLKFDKFRDSLMDIKSSSTLEKIYEAEYAGRNREARPRKSRIDLIKKHMESGKVGGVGEVKATDEEKVIIQ